MFGDRKRREQQRKRQVRSTSRGSSSGSFSGTGMSHSTFDNYDCCDNDRDYGDTCGSSDSSSSSDD